MVLLLGCAGRNAPSAVSRPAQMITPSTTAPRIPDAAAAALAPGAPPARLPFKAHLAEGDRAELPPAVAASLAPESPITVAYREQLIHQERHVSLLKSAFDPATYIGAPLGDYGVAAFATLTIMRGDVLLGHYTARSYESKSYSLYAEPTHRELDDAARRDVRAKIDAAIAADNARLAAAAR